MNELAKERRLLWSLLVRGDAEVYLRVSHGPPLDHQGGETLWKALFTPSEMDAAEAYLTGQGLTVQRMRQGRQEIRDSQPEAVHFTAALSDFDPTQIVYRAPECPLCYYFQPQSRNQCGVEDWPPESVKASRNVAKAVEDLARCPVHGRVEGGE